jgi:hypothetical protein
MLYFTKTTTCLAEVHLVDPNTCIFKSNKWGINYYFPLNHLGVKSCPDHTKVSIWFQLWNCWGSCSEIDVGTPLFTLLQPVLGESLSYKLTLDNHLVCQTLKNCTCTPRGDKITEPFEIGVCTKEYCKLERLADWPACLPALVSLNISLTI